MAYQRRIYNLIFEDPAMNGLEVKAKSVSIGTMRQLQGLGSDDKDQFLMIELFAKALVSWNLEDDGIPVPATLEGLEDQDPAFVLEIVNAWVDTVTGVPDASPLDEGSASGELSLVESIPMETLSGSQAS